MHGPKRFQHGSGFILDLVVRRGLTPSVPMGTEGGPPLGYIPKAVFDPDAWKRSLDELNAKQRFDATGQVCNVTLSLQKSYEKFTKS